MSSRICKYKKVNEDIYRKLSRQNTKSIYNKRESLRKVHNRSALKTFVKEEKSLKKFVVLRDEFSANENRYKIRCSSIARRLK